MNRHSKFISVSVIGIILNSWQFSPSESFDTVILSSSLLDACLIFE
jgi:hypothetical protein